MPSSGGGLGWPFRRKGAESLRILPEAADLNVLWMVGDRAVAHLVTVEEATARRWFAWLAARFGSGAERLPDPPASESDATRETVVREFRQRRPIVRHAAVLCATVRGVSPHHTVVDVVDGAVRSAAHVVDVDEGAELLALLVTP